MIGGAVAGGRRRHVGEHDIGGPAQALSNRPGASAVSRSSFSTVTPAIGSISRISAPTNAAPPTRAAPPDSSPRAQRPDRARARRFQEMEFVVQLDQLERRARAVAFGLGFGDIGIVELALSQRADTASAPCCGCTFNGEPRSFVFFVPNPFSEPSPTQGTSRRLPGARGAGGSDAFRSRKVRR